MTNRNCSAIIWYALSLPKKVTQGSTVDWKQYLFAEGQAVALYSRKSTGTNALSYLLRDHQGSVDAIPSGSGAILVRASYDPYGNRRGTAWSSSPSAGDLTTINGLTRRGYAGHEMLDSTALIHMNGRVQDPLPGRFVSADPMLDPRLGMHPWNRYEYVGNNPLTFTDPSGFGLTNVRRHDAWINGDRPPGLDVEVAIENGLGTVMAYGRRESGISEPLVQLLDVPRPGGGGGGDGGGAADGVVGRRRVRTYRTLHHLVRAHE